MEQEFILIGAILGGLFIGAFCGGAPLVIGLVNKRKLFAWLSFVFCIAFGVICTTLLQSPAFLTFIPAVILSVLMLVIKKIPKE